MPDLNLMATFARVVEAGSFSEAARRLNSSRSAVSKAVAKLEAEFGARLLNRSTRALSLTEIGAAVAEHCARIVDESEQAEQAAGSLHGEVRGVLRVAASVAFGTLQVAPALAEFLARHPDLRLDVTITDRMVDLASEGYDVMIRVMGEPPGNMVARRLAPVTRQLCATPDYFARHGVPNAPQDLAKHDCVIYARAPEKGHWRLFGPAGEILVPVSGRLQIDDNEALSQAVLAGLGIGLLPTFIVGRDLQEGRLQAVLSEYVSVQQHVYALYLPTRHLPAKVRAFIDFFLKRYGPQPYWDRDGE